MTENEIDSADLAIHEIDKEPVTLSSSDEDADQITFDIMPEPIFKRLAMDIYEEDAAGIREIVSNSITAILKAVDSGYIERQEGALEIKFTKEGDSKKLTIKDNGIGMSRKRIKELLSVIGVSDSRDDGGVAGQFGMGFLPAFRLVGIDGGFEMHTNARYVDEDPISGIWKSGGFTIDDDGVMLDSMDADEYGTKFGFMLKQEISQEDIHEWVEEYSEWSRVTVRYEEVVDGSVVYDEDYGGPDKTLESNLSENEPYVAYEDEFVKAISAPSIDGTYPAILLDVPVSVTDRNIVSTPLGGMAVRFKNENGVIVDGPNKGMMVTNEKEYESMNASRQEKYITDSEMSMNDIQLPQPVGTRRTLDGTDEFWEWLETNLKTNLAQKLYDIFTTIESKNVDSMLDLPKEQFNCVFESMNKTREWELKRNPNTPSKFTDSVTDLEKFIRKYSNQFNIGMDFKEQLAILNSNTRLAMEDDNNISKSRNLTRFPLYRFYYDVQNNDADVYMGVRLGRDKADVVWEDNADNIVISVKNTDFYDIYTRHFDFKLLKEINQSTIDTFDVSEETNLQFKNNTKSKSRSQNASKEHTIHTGSPVISNRKYTTEELQDILDSDTSSDMYGQDISVNALILFPSHKNKNISDYKQYATPSHPMMKCRKMDWEELSEFDRVTLFDEHKERARNVSIKTPEGVFTVGELIETYADSKSIYFQLFDSDQPYYDILKQDKYLQRTQERADTELQFDVLYVPIDKETFLQIHPFTDGFKVDDTGYPHTYSLASRSRRLNNMQVYAYARLYPWKGTPTFQELTNRRRMKSKLNENGYELIETVRNGFQAQTE